MPDLIQDRICPPDEHAAVPEEVSGVQESLCCFDVRFLRERPDRLRRRLLALVVASRSKLDVPVAGGREVRCDANRDECTGFGGFLCGHSEDLMESIDLLDEMVRRQNDHDSFRVASDQLDSRVENAWRRITADRFGDDVLRRDLLQLLACLGHVLLIGDDKAPARRDESVQSSDGSLNQCVVAEHLQELLGACMTTLGPEAASYAAGHDYCVEIHVVGTSLSIAQYRLPHITGDCWHASGVGIDGLLTSSGEHVGRHGLDSRSSRFFSKFRCGQSLAVSHPEIASEAVGYQSLTSSIHKTLCVLAVHYNNADEVQRYVDHVLGLPLPEGWRAVVSVTDNSLNWPTGIDMDERCFIWTPEANLGYLNGCAYGLACWRSTEGDDPDWVAVTNTDITFQEDAFVCLLRADWSVSAAAVAPKVTTRDGLQQNPFLTARPSVARIRLSALICRKPTLQKFLILTRRLRRPVYKLLQRMKSMDGVPKPVRRLRLRRNSGVGGGASTIYAPHGSAVFLMRRFFDVGCTLEIDWKMFGEELHIAEQIRKAGLEVLYSPEIRVQHQLASSTGRINDRQLLSWKAEAYDRLLNAHFLDD